MYIDTDAMDNYYNVSGYQLASWANRGLHGGMNVGNNTPYVWHDAIEETADNRELLKLPIEYLKIMEYR